MAFVSALLLFADSLFLDEPVEAQVIDSTCNAALCIES
jgi:hypothetical protein